MRHPLTEMYIAILRRCETCLMTPYSNTSSRTAQKATMTLETVSSSSKNCQMHRMNPVIEKKIMTLRAWKQHTRGWKELDWQVHFTLFKASEVVEKFHESSKNRTHRSEKHAGMRCSSSNENTKHGEWLSESEMKPVPNQSKPCNPFENNSKQGHKSIFCFRINIIQNFITLFITITPSSFFWA